MIWKISPASTLVPDSCYLLLLIHVIYFLFKYTVTFNFFQESGRKTLIKRPWEEMNGNTFGPIERGRGHSSQSDCRLHFPEAHWKIKIAL